MATTPITTTTTPPSTPIIHGPLNFENLNESWCELKYKSGCSSTGSITHLHHSVNPEVLEKLLQEAQREVSQSPSPQPPQILLVAGEDTYLIARDQEHYIDSDKSSMYCLSSNESSTPILVEVTSSLVSPIKTSFQPSLLVEELNKSLKASPFECTHCCKHKNEISLLLEKQAEQEKLLFKLRQEYEEKVLYKSPEFVLSSSHSSPMSSSSSTSIIEEESRFDDVKYPCKIVTTSLKRQNSSTATLVSPNNNFNSVELKCPTNNIPYNNMPTSNDLIMSTGYSSGIFNYKSGNVNCESADWSKYWSSRPQNQPPKEWNFVHPNSAKSKYNIKKMDDDEDTSFISKLLNKENIGKLIFTHMASFIVGATLMFLVLRRHLNLKNSYYFI